jgi:APA family basic amino acid/polyamine antiporter
MRRALSAFDVTCIGLNAIVGSGIYLFPGQLAAALGPASTLAWCITGALCLPLAFTFAALGTHEVRSGGPFRYTQLAFGLRPAFLVGWCAWVTSAVSWAAVASGLPSYLGSFVPALGSGVPATLVSVCVVVLLGALNVRGVKLGARVTNALTIGKLVPLVLFVGVGLCLVEPRRFQPFAPTGFAAMPALALMTMFAYQGFEVVGVPVGEVRDPQRSVPRAVVASILLSALLYVLVQVVFVGVGARSTAAPLPDAAGLILGSAGTSLLALGGLVSMLGFNAGTALCAPRYLQALAEEHLLPPKFALIHARFGTPAVAVVATTLVTLLLLLLLDFGGLVDLAVLAVLVQYLASSAALVRLARQRRLKLLGAASMLVSIGFGFGCEPRQFLYFGLLAAAGILLALGTRWFAARADAA